MKRDSIELHIQARIAEIERIVGILHGRYVDIHPLNGFIGRIIDRVRVSHPAGSANSAFQSRRASIDCELRRSIEDDKHLLALIMEMVADPAARHDLAPVHELQVRGEGVAGDESLTGHVAGAAVGPAPPILARVCVSDPLRERIAGHRGGCGEHEQHDYFFHTPLRLAVYTSFDAERNYSPTRDIFNDKIQRGGKA